MIISRDSRHYKLVDAFLDRPSKSLCVYFWQVIFFSLLVLVLAIFACTVVWMVVVCPLFALLWALPIHGFEYAISDSYAHQGVFMTGLSIAIIELAVGGIFFVIWFVKKMSGTSQRIMPEFASEYVRAKKEKVCPRITFK